MASNKKIFSENSVDPGEIAKFEAMADEWWDESGKFKPLHQLNPVRIKFIRDTTRNHFSALSTQHSAPLKGLRLLDIGCGGGLLSEPLSRLGAKVTGIDASEKNIKIAQLHAETEGLDIDYRCITAEEFLNTEHRAPNTFSVVTAMEIIEHVADVPSFIESCCSLVKPGGLLFFSTLNRTVKSYAMAIVGAEYVLRWLPRGTHDWNKFLRPSEIVIEAEKHGMKALDVCGVTYNPLNSQWSLSEDTDVNYMVVLKKN